MAKKLGRGGLKLVSGGPGRRPMVWRVSAPGLSRTYTFVPGAPTFVEPEDLAWFGNPDNTEGRVFEVVAPEADPTSAPAAPASPPVRGASGRSGPASGAASGTTTSAGTEGGGPATADATTDKD